MRDFAEQIRLIDRQIQECQADNLRSELIKKRALLEKDMKLRLQDIDRMVF